jgi:hypothetical protein
MAQLFIRGIGETANTTHLENVEEEIPDFVDDPRQALFDF